MNFRARGINALWATLLIEELTRCGVIDFVISPGSRSTPLTLAVAHNKKASSLVHYDERGAAYYAVGLTRATERPTALISTSGTAGANYYPALVEATMSRLPLIVLTADRPPELQNCGANQTINQRNLYGHYSREFINLDCPSVDIEASELLKTIDKAVKVALSSPAGPVHINCMFREPLAPTKNEQDFSDYLAPLNNWHEHCRPPTSIEPTLPIPDEAEIDRAVRSLGREKGLLVIGRLHTNRSRHAVLRLAKHLRWPTIVDLLSGLRGQTDKASVIPCHDLDICSAGVIVNKSTPVLYIGEQIISKRVQLLLERIQPETFLRVIEYPYQSDPGQIATQQIVGDLELVCQALIKGTESADSAEIFAERAEKVDQLLNKQLSNNSLTEPAVVRSVSRLIDNDSVLFIGNSLPIRECDSFFAYDKRLPAIGCNRGASGIDGNIASAIGFATGYNRPLTLIIGDLAFLHDLSSLVLLKNSPPITIIVFNNDGGGIFSFLPIAERTEHFEKYFGTPHGLNFESAAAMFDLEYYSPRSRSEFEKIYKTVTDGTNTSIIEIRTDRLANRMLHEELLAKIDELS